MAIAAKQEKAEAKIGQTLEEYFSQAKTEHASIRTISRDLGVNIITAKIWADQYRHSRYHLVFGPLFTALFVLVIGGIVVGAFLTWYWFNPY
jgi:hypothetical protein